MAEFFIRRPIVAMVIAILTCIVGAISLSRLPISEYPNVSPTMIQATTSYRGAAAEAVMVPISTVIGLFLIPVCYVFVQKFADRKKNDDASSLPEAHEAKTHH